MRKKVSNEGVVAQGKALHERRYYLSFSNLVNELCDSHGRSVQVGLISKNVREDGTWLVSAIGGGAHLAPAGKEVADGLGADFANTERTVKTDDARFIVTLQKKHAAKTIARLQLAFAQVPGLLASPDQDMMREIREELGMETTENPDGHDVLSEREINQIRLQYVSTLCPRVWRDDSTDAGKKRQRKGIETRRVFRMYRMIVPPYIFDKIVASQKIHVVSQEDCSLLTEACREGRGSTVNPYTRHELAANLALTGDFQKDY